MSVCPNGHPVDPGVIFCQQCGVPLTLMGDPALARPLAEETTVAAPLAPVYEELPPEPPRASNAVIYTVAGAIIVLALVAIGLALILNSGGGSQNPAVQAPVGGATDQPTNSTTASASPGQPIPTGGTLCPGKVGGQYSFGTIGKNTSCDFVQAVYQSYQASGRSSAPISATSKITGRTYDNITCTKDATGSWVTCVGARSDSAHMFFAAP